MRLLVTRLLPDAARQVERLKALGHDAIAAPMLEVQFLDTNLPRLSAMQALIATSRTGLRAIEMSANMVDALKLPLFAVGGATAKLARKLGFREVHEGPGTGEQLLPLITSHCAPDGGALLHLAGEQLAYDLKPPLEAQGFEVEQPILYRTCAVDGLDDEARAAMTSGALDGVILMSPATARAYVTLVAAQGLGDEAAELAHFCLSHNVADPLAALDGAPIFIADSPSEDDLLALIARITANC